MLARILACLAITILLVGCVSTKKRYQKAQEHESAGEYLEAANLYIRVLEKDREYEDARARLLDVGAQAIAAIYETSEELENDGDFEGALQQLRQMADLRARADEVRVILTLPADFDERLVFYREAALDSLTRQAEEAAAAGNLEEARTILERIRTEYELDEPRRVDIDHRLGDVLVALAESDMRDERFKAAYDTALRAIEVLDGYNDEAEQRARNAATAALAQGIRTVALVPFWQTDDWRRIAPVDLRADVNDAIAFGEAGRRPEFLAIIDPGQTRRLVRSMGFDAEVLTVGQMLTIGRELDADFVLTGEMTGYTRDDRIRRSRKRETRTRGRGGVDTSYTWQDLDIRTKAMVSYRVLDVRSRSIVLEDSEEAEARVRVERGSYPGNWTTLDLSGSEQRLFDEDEWLRQDRDLMITLSDDLAERLMRKVDDRLLRLID